MISVWNHTKNHKIKIPLRLNKPSESMLPNGKLVEIFCLAFWLFTALAMRARKKPYLMNMKTLSYGKCGYKWSASATQASTAHLIYWFDAFYFPNNHNKKETSNFNDGFIDLDRFKYERSSHFMYFKIHINSNKIKLQ